ncbi:MAG: flagellar biosynthetic protein FliO [Clostridia bacterium]|nr:flagellar biosynthetic protein FliO [Clostridia bacterium]
MGWLDGVMTFLSLIFAFAVILGLAYVTTKIVASASFKKYKNKNMRLLEGMQLGPQKTLQLVRVGNKILLLALTKDNVVKLDTFYSHELNVSEEELDKRVVSFEEVFNNMTRSFMHDDNENNKNENIESTSIKNECDSNEVIINNSDSNKDDDEIDIKTLLFKTHRR